jgi:hypothetical protein
MARLSRLTLLALGGLAAIAGGLWLVDRRNAAIGTVAALVGCLGLILPPRERMAVLPWRLRALPRRYDAAPVLASIASTPGYGLHWFYGANPYDEVVHLLSGLLAGAVFAALLLADGRPRGWQRRAAFGAACGLLLGGGWEVFEWWTGLIGGWTDTWTDVALTALGSAIAAALPPAPQRG